MLVAGACGADDRPDPHAASAKAQAAAAEPVRLEATAPANGWGEGIAWQEFEPGKQKAAELGRPLMLVVHASWCKSCRALKPTFHEADFTELSHEFVMVNVDQDQMPAIQSYGPDGTYVPRIMFFNENGELASDITNSNNPRYRYYYSPKDDLMGRMRDALAKVNAADAVQGRG